MGFWAVLSFVVSSQVGSGVFLFPHTLAPFGTLGLLAWGLAGLGAILLALVFAGLCRRYPFTGGPHVYVTKGFGRRWLLCGVDLLGVGVAELSACAWDHRKLHVHFARVAARSHVHFAI